MPLNDGVARPDPGAARIDRAARRIFPMKKAHA
ncbi:hypothetical protein SAMN05444340_106163 [Citreimonas salinaria]|uniref:Uncharacterized protein n=1 Tax=Citreimonas salinaria TaxID=321339 RepID=A0A1H3JAP9_9RHOB|nr:hypothetical protein SAMN05444340_106163 [Citreimonas salinaria]